MAVIRVEEMDKVPLEGALSQLGGTKFENTLAVVAGLILFAGLEVILAPSYIIPAAKCDLNLDDTQKGLLLSVVFTGMIFSSHLIGYLSDTYGRKTVIVKSCLASSTLLFASSFSPTVEVMYVLWMMHGFFVSGIISPAYVYVTEFTVVERKAKLLLISSAVASLATTYQPGMAWLILPMDTLDIWGFKYNSWRLFTVISASIPLICCILLSMFPESPKFLMTAGKAEQTLKDLKRMFVFNTGLSRDQYKVNAVTVDKGDEHEANKVTGILQFFKSLVKQTILLISPAYLLYTFLGSTLQLGIVGVYNVIMMWVPDIVNEVTEYSNSHVGQPATVCEIIELSNADPRIVSIGFNDTVSLVNNFYNVSVSATSECSKINEEVFITNMLIGCLQFVAFLVASSLTALMGRKNFIASNLFLATISVFMLTWVTTPYIIFACMGIVAVLLGATLPVTMSIVVDLFPTFIRSMGSAMCMVFGRIGVAIGNPLFGYIQQINCNAGYYGLTVLLGGICCLSFLLPVKRNIE